MKIAKQSVLSEKSRILVGTYTTKSGQVKNRYEANPNAKHLKTLTHKLYVASKDEKNTVENNEKETEI